MRTAKTTDNKFFNVKKLSFIKYQNKIGITINETEKTWKRGPHPDSKNSKAYLMPYIKQNVAGVAAKIATVKG
jgi:hypothetical protein